MGLFQSRILFSILFLGALAACSSSEESQPEQPYDKELDNYKCHDDTDACGGFCVLPEDYAVECNLASTGSGPCESDAECSGYGAHYICIQEKGYRCFPIGFTVTCTPGCEDDGGCASGEVCNLQSHRCEPKPCSQGSQCGDNFTCNDGSCARISCTYDSECSGYCVFNACHEEPGLCILP